VVDKSQLLTESWSIHGFYATNCHDFLIGEGLSMMWQSQNGQQCLYYNEKWSKDGSLSSEISPYVEAKYVNKKQ
jgi:hypothetical protein